MRTIIRRHLFNSFRSHALASCDVGFDLRGAISAGDWDDVDSTRETLFWSNPSFARLSLFFNLITWLLT